MKNRIISLMITVSLLLVTCLNNKAIAMTDSLDVWTEDTLVKVALTDTIPAEPSTAINLVTAKNEYENAQIVLRSTSDFTVNGITFTDLTDGTNTISSSNLSYNFQLYDMIAWIVDEEDGQYEERLYPDEQHLTYDKRYPDPLSNEDTCSVSANETQPIWIKLYTPKDTPAGTYTGTISVNTTIDTEIVTREIAISVEVCDVTLPDGKDSDFKMYNWSATNTFSVSGVDFGKRFYDVKKYSPEWWALMEDFAERMIEQRQNMITVWTLGLLLDAGTKVIDDGTNYSVNFNWTYFDKFIETFENAGIRYFGGDHLAAHWEGTPGSYNYQYEMIRKLGIRGGETDIVGGEITNNNVTALNVDTEKWLDAYLPALKVHLEEKGWADRWYQHVLDEPKDVRTWKLMVNKIHEYGLKSIDADNSGKLKDVSEADVYVPLTSIYHDNKSIYDNHKIDGKELFLYVCLGPEPPWLNRFVDQPRLTNQLLFWYHYQNKADGFLHWAWNAWHQGASWEAKTLGDTMIVYPDKDNMTVMSSVRNETQRDGLEDTELLKILEVTNAEKANAFVNALVTNGKKYSKDIAYIRKTRNHLVRAAAGQDVGVPEPDPLPEPEPIVVAGVVNNTNTNICYIGDGWMDAGYRGFGEIEDDASFTTDNTDYVEISFIGTGIEAIASKNHNNGEVEVYIDGKLIETVDFYNSSRLVQSRVFSKKDLSNDLHTLKMVKKSGDYMNIDAFEIFIEPTTNTPVTINNTDSDINYVGDEWTHESVRNLGEIEDDASYTTKDGDYVEYTFNGTGIEVIAAKNDNNGEVDVFIDDELIETINNNASPRAPQSVVFSKKDLTDGEHTIRLVKKNSQYMNIDAFKVY